VSAASVAAAVALRPPKVQVGDAGEQMRFNERERGAGWRLDVRNAAKYVQGTSGVSLRDADHCARVGNETRPRPIGLGRESG
jgi:hypothetical protein